MTTEQDTAAETVAPEAPAVPGFLARVGLAIVHPRWALALGGDRRRAGGSGSDLLAMIALFLCATQLRWLIGAGWLGGAVDAGLGLRAFAAVLTQALTVDLGFLVLGALLVFFAAGPRRDLGRAFDLACVAALPLLVVDLGASVIAFALHVEPLPVLGYALSGLAYGWTGVLLALAIGPARMATKRSFAVPPAVVAPARRAGWVIVALVLVGVAAQGRWIGAHGDDLRPLESGGPAPAFSLARIDDSGHLGAPITLAALAGKPVVLDFWATWCGPCLQSLPGLSAFAKAHPEVSVLAINLDDPMAARALFRDRGYAPILVAGDDDISRRYNVATIPHTVVIDAAGQVRKVGHAGDMDLDGTIAALAK